MTSRPRAGKIVPEKYLHRRAVNHEYAAAEDGLLPEWRFDAERVRRECEEIHEHCRRQMEMIAAQRAFLRNLKSPYGVAPGETRAPEAAGAGGALEEEMCSGE